MNVIRNYKKFLLRYFLVVYPIAIMGMWVYNGIQILLPRFQELFKRWFPGCLSRIVLYVNNIKVTVRGTAYVKNITGPCVFCANHESVLDPYLCLAYIPMRFKMFQSNTNMIHRARMQVAMNFLTKFDLAFLHDRFDRRRMISEFEKAAEHVKDGNNLLLFPEGQANHNGTVDRFSISGFRIPIMARAPIVPVVIHGTRAQLENRPLGGVGDSQGVIVEFLPPIFTRNLTKKDQVDLAGRVHAAIEKRHATMGCRS